jgi:hypothetical protein
LSLLKCIELQRPGRMYKNALRPLPSSWSAAYRGRLTCKMMKAFQYPSSFFFFASRWKAIR